MRFKEIKKYNSCKADCEVIIVSKEKDIIDKKDLKLLSFKIETEEVAFLPHLHRIYVGVDELNSNESRLALFNAIKKIKGTKYKSLKIKVDNKSLLKGVVEGIILGSYSFDKYKSSKSRFNLKTIYIAKSFNKKIVKEAKIVAESVNFAKDIVNRTPEDIYPEKLAKLAKKVAKSLNNTSCEVYDEKFLKREGMNLFYAVGRASIHKPRLIHLKYRPENPKKRIALVGKGLTYDSGGLSLKPSNAMLTMKLDKSGAISVLSILKAVAELKLPIEIDCIIGAAENMIGGNAYKPDDVFVAKNGKRVEVRNTDAEGRLVLADCLCYAQELKPDYIVDMATLTGACVVALGEYTFGVMGHNSNLKHTIIKSANRVGELASSLPFNRYLKRTLKSNVADISNISSSRYGGAITASLFLDAFIEEKNKDRWIHLDIAGPAYNENGWGYNQPGGTGAGVRTCVEWIKNL